ncbi:MAG: hypothetical protein H6851_06320 [Geminicoccaceae bacterium]|nr:hypothetical protein [Geminicoccaceae bacterium]
MNLVILYLLCDHFGWSMWWVVGGFVVDYFAFRELAQIGNEARVAELQEIVNEALFKQNREIEEKLDCIARRVSPHSAYYSQFDDDEI